MPNLILRLFNGLREPIEDAKFQATVVDGKSKILPSVSSEKPEMTIPLVLKGDFLRDQFTINVSAKGYRDAGFIGFRFKNANDAALHLMLVHRNAVASFRRPSDWPTKWSQMEHRMGEGFLEFAEGARQEAACLLNLLEAIRLFQPGVDNWGLVRSIPLKKGDSHTREKREEGVLQDRALVLVDTQLRPRLEDLAKSSDPIVKPETAAAHGGLKPGEKAFSFKEVRFPEANLQFTLFERNETVYGDIDMDYFRDKFSHGLLEVFPNTLFGTRTDPRKIYALRWMAGKNLGTDEFAPPYVLAP